MDRDEQYLQEFSYKPPHLNLRQKGLLTSNCWISRFLLAVKARIHLTVVILITGEKVSSKSMPYFLLKPFATNLALDRSRVPLAFSFTLYTYLQPMNFYRVVDPQFPMSNYHVKLWALFVLLQSIMDFGKLPYRM